MSSTGLIYVAPQATSLNTPISKAAASEAALIAQATNAAAATEFDNVQIQGNGVKIDLSKTGDTYLPSAQIGQTTDTVAGAPPTAASLAQAARSESGQANTVNGSVSVNQQANAAAAANAAATSASVWYEQPIVLVLGAGLFGLLGLHILKGKK